MSWNAHTDYVFNQLPGQLKCLTLTGSDGSKWGESGTSVTANACDLLTCKKTPTGGVKLDGEKYMYLRELDGICVYNKKGEGAAFWAGTQYTAYAVAAEGYKAEQCVTALEKLKAYLAGIGYN